MPAKALAGAAQGLRASSPASRLLRVGARGEEDHRGAQFAAAEAAHLGELAVTHRQVLAVQGLAVLAVVDIRVVEVDEVLIAVGDYHLSLIHI